MNLGQGGAAVHLLDVNCTGAESNLLECVDSGSGMTPLSMVDGDCSMPAGVICEGKCLLSMMYIIDYCGKIAIVSTFNIRGMPSHGTQHVRHSQLKGRVNPDYSDDELQT